MTAPAAARILHFPSTVIVGPSSTTVPGSDGAYGGTLIGKVEEIGFQTVGEEPFGLWAECYGEDIDYLEGSNMFELGMNVMAWDDNAVAQFMPSGYTAGTKTKHAKFTKPGTRTPGQSALEPGNTRDKVVMLLPEDKIHVPTLILYRAIPDWTQAATMALERKSKFGVPLTFRCLRNGSGHIYQWSMLADLDLT
jgi:hypothetical protein